MLENAINNTKKTIAIAIYAYNDSLRLLAAARSAAASCEQRDMHGYI
jgi:hypothetical protein